MLISYFSPTHRLNHIRRTAASLASQTRNNFEWVVVPNGAVSKEAIEELRIELPQLRIVPYTGATTNIGELKNFACGHCRGDVLAELDHDDELTPNCTEVLERTFAEPVDFAYSNWAETVENHPTSFNPAHGWVTRPFLYEGQAVRSKSTWAGFLETVSFPPTPDSFCKVWYAPNHIRAWRKSFYDAIGGHDKSLPAADDHELCCRSFIHGKVKHIDQCLYIYHNHSENSFRGELNSLIQTKTVELHDIYAEPMVVRWSLDNGYRLVNIGGLGSMDRMEVISPSNELPFPDNSVGLIKAVEVLQRISNPIKFMEEVYRCLVPGGWLISYTPSTDGRGAFQDPTHRSFWNENSFWYYTKEQNRYIKSAFTLPVRFYLPRLVTYFPNDFAKEHNIPFVRADLFKPHNRAAGLLEV